LLRRAVLVIVGVLVVLLPASWYWGHRTGKPLLQLSDAMRQVGVKVPPAGELNLYESRDEIGQLGSAFRRMLEELRKKERLERQVVSSERLAAVGRLAAGIAHEINNPLGGMLNAISTFKRHGGDTEMTDRTIALLERGLVQIKDTVAALLVEARVESHPLTAEDLEDVRTLIQPQIHRKRAVLQWRVNTPTSLQMPSTLVRQILINLLLNAAAAVEDEGHIECTVEAQGAELLLLVVNSGRHIGSERLPYLFEPFSTQQGEGHGLGLWVTYQIVQQLHGRIVATTREGETKFVVSLPMQEPG
jgi:two-component system NtrC family sensor kinase